MSIKASAVVLVVPCYGAERWMDAESIIEWLAHDTDPRMLVRLLFVHEFRSASESVPRKINRWLDHIAYSAPSREQPGRVRIMQLQTRSKRVGRADALRQAIIEALHWPEPLGGPPSVVGLWNAELAAFSGAAALARSLDRHASAHFLALGGTSSHSSAALNALACLAVGLPVGQPRTEHAPLSSRDALLIRVTPTLHAAVGARFRTPRLFVCELLARYVALQAGERRGFASPLVVPVPAPVHDACTAEGWVYAGAAGGGHLDGVDVHGRQYDTASISTLRILHSLAMIRILYHWRHWPSGSIKPTTLMTCLVIPLLVVMISGVWMSVMTVMAVRI